MTEYVELVVLVQAAYNLDPVVPFEPKNAPSGKGGAGDLPGVKLCPYLSTLRDTASLLGIRFRTFDSKRCFCGILTLTDGSRVSFATCHFLRSLIDSKSEGLEEVKERIREQNKEIKRKNAEAEAKAEERFQRAMAAHEKREATRRNAFINYWNLPRHKQIEVRENLRKSFPPPKKQYANPTALFSEDPVPREVSKASAVLGGIGGSPGYATSIECLSCPLVSRILF